jgi:hypothetical protein
MSEADAVIPYRRDERYVLKNENRQMVAIVFFPNQADTTDKIKINVPVYGGTADEDPEAFFEMFTEFERATKAKKIWDDDRTQNTDSSELFLRFGVQLSGTAKADWEDIRKKYPGEAWKDWKAAVAEFILEKVVAKKDAYERQVEYMENRSMPAGMGFTTWWKRFLTANRYLPYLLTRQKMEEVSDGKEKELKSQWKYGSFGDARQKDILLRHVPRAWKDTFDRSALDRQAPIAKIIEYFEGEEEREKRAQRRRQLQQQRGNPLANRGGGRHFEARRQNRFNGGRGGGYSGRGGPHYSRGGEYYSRGGKFEHNNYSRGGQNNNRGTGIEKNRGGRPTGRGFGRSSGGGRSTGGRMNQATGGSARYPEQAFTMESQDDEEEYRAYGNDDEERLVEEDQSNNHFQSGDDDVGQLDDEWNQNLWLTFDEESAERF